LINIIRNCRYAQAELADLPTGDSPSSPPELQRLALSLWAQWHGLAVLALGGALADHDAGGMLVDATRRLVRRASTRFELSTVPAAGVTEPPPHRDDA